ncbi:MmsB 3-hydroxyisobutyrate dehydrogenase and related beta-hydroxyacid dehydrogenases [Rhabdaerophilaceae bacterium]
MGLPMIRHLVTRGYGITAFDVLPERCALGREAGATIAPNASSVAAAADLVLLNLPTVEAVESAVFGAGGLAGTLKAGQLIVDFSTIPVEKCRALGHRLRDQTGCGWVDAPVSGGPSASATGSLTVMVGGNPGDIAVASSLLGDVSRRLTVMGGPGAGLAAKMINQLIVGCTHAVLSEALILAEAAGIDAARIPESLAGGHADSTLLQLNYPRMAAREFAPQGYARQLLKDLEMVSSFAGALKAPTPMTGEALNLYRLLVHLGHAEADTTAIVKIFDRP